MLPVVVSDSVTAVTESAIVDVTFVSEPAASVDEAALLMALSTSQPASVVAHEEPNTPGEEPVEDETTPRPVKEKAAKRARKRSRPAVELRTRMGRVTFTQSGAPIIVQQPVVLSEPFGALAFECLLALHWARLCDCVSVRNMSVCVLVPSASHLQSCSICPPEHPSKTAVLSPLSLSEGAYKRLAVPGFRVREFMCNGASEHVNNGRIADSVPGALGGDDARPVDDVGYDAGITASFHRMWLSGRVGSKAFREEIGEDGAAVDAVGDYDVECDYCTAGVRTPRLTSSLLLSLRFMAVVFGCL
jgi:hypothetical protein